ncbi:hypothetical protein C0Q70_04869 [Pomacea canaliculata]|uniref:Uncharacterized protein n=1 Tax=Pomacea canaliculata TaxID=400727 RepID=A0A2T7PJK3_POMCA|nr:hypothetical protein C0Q70_04869 [Pomacea canaliculata]
MSLLGFHCAPPQQSPPRGKTESGTDEKRRNLVSDPGKPGYSSDLPHGFGTDPDGQARKYNVTSTSPPLFSRYDSSPPPFSRYDISSPPFSRYDSSPPLFSRYDSSPPLDVGANDSKIAPTPGIENYLGHSLLGRDAGILISSGKPLLLACNTFPPDHPHTQTFLASSPILPSVASFLFDRRRRNRLRNGGKTGSPSQHGGRDGSTEMLQDISEVREQARTLDRMELVRQREERNKAKFQHGLDFANAATIKRSASPPRNRPSFNSSEKSPTVEGKSADFSFTTQSKQKEDSSNNFGVQNRTVSPTSLTEKSPPKKVSGKVHKTARDQQSDKNTPKPTQTADKGDAMSSPSITSPSKGSKDALTADLKANQRTEDRDPQAQACSSASDVEDAKRRNIGCFGGNAKNILKKNNSTRKSRATERCERCSAPIADGKVRGDACHCSNPSHVRSGARKTSSPSPRFNQSVTNNPGKGK